jgi:acetyl-CoA carboxylase biotin carboxyl carrier protein
MDLTEDDVLEILKLFEHSKFDYLHLEQGGRKITVSKGGFVPSQADAAPVRTNAAPARADAAPGRAGPPPAVPQPAPKPEIAVVDEGLVATTAPMMGKFYAAPSPSDPPFVEIGQRVAAGATLGLIEVMKVFASVKSDVAGVVEKILIANGESVEYGQALFFIRPDLPGGKSTA